VPLRAKSKSLAARSRAAGGREVDEFEVGDCTELDGSFGLADWADWAAAWP
jgi:hypothetical protein